MKCKICNADSSKIFSAVILNKYNAEYYQCPECEYLFTEEPYWLDEAYTNSIFATDIGYASRNIYLREAILPIIAQIKSEKSFLDVGGGVRTLCSHDARCGI